MPILFGKERGEEIVREPSYIECYVKIAMFVLGDICDF